jgi:uncharacterized protein (TIGR03435 family)
MLQRLLADRFQFAAHHEMREGVHSVLRVAKGGAKLKEAAAVDNDAVATAQRNRVRNDQANSRIICTGASINDLLSRLYVSYGGLIYDQTGLNRTFAVRGAGQSKVFCFQ